MEQEKLRVLSRPFAEIRTRPGRSGHAMSYIEGHQVVLRLNEALAGDWSFKVLQHQVLEDEVVVLGELRAGEVVKQAFGGSEVTRTRDGKVVSLADDLKAAATDSLKKAATLLGVGLRLHGAEEAVVPVVGAAVAAVTAVGSAQPGPKLVPNGLVVSEEAEVPAGGRLTPRQAGFIEKLAKTNGLSAGELEDLARERYGRLCGQLSVQQASELIRVLGRAA
jgi:hypothetical protein